MGKDVIIACDFSKQGGDLGLPGPVFREETLCEDRHGALLCRGAGDRPGHQGQGHQIFLDLKLHDIPNTVKKAMAVLSKLDVDMINLHAAGTRAMMEAALEGGHPPRRLPPLVIAVTQLTSTSQERMQEELLISAPMDQTVMHYAANAAQAGLDGWCAPPWRRERSMRDAARASSP